MISFTVPIDPIPQPRPKFSRGKVYQPKRIVEYKEQVRLAAMTAIGQRIIEDEPLTVRLIFYRKFNPTSRNYGDFDNLAKAICDALNKFLYKDDSQIVSCTIEKRQDKENPRVEIFVEDSIAIE